jgi:hypothetical protein
MLRALCDYLVIASVIVLALGTPARAQDTPPQSRDTPAQEAAPAPAPTPSPAQETPAPVATPAPAPDAVPAPHAAPAARSREPIGAPSRARAQGGPPDRIRGLVTSVDASSMVVKTHDGRSLRLGLSINTTVFSLTRGNFADVTFGTYVGSVSEQLGDDIYSPIRRQSLSWLHKGYELRIFDEQLRGLAVGFTKWDLTRNSVMTHGWVDDMEDRVLSIKYGPTEEEETDVEVLRDIPIQKISLGDKHLLKAGAHVFAGAQKGPDGNYAAVFIFVGKDGIVPGL